MTTLATTLGKATLESSPYLVRDSFNRANGSLGRADSGQIWQGAGLTISSNRVAADGVATYQQDVDSGLADCEVSATFSLSGTLSNGTGMRLRAASGVSGDRLALHWEVGGGNVTALTLYRVVSGGFTAIGSWAISSPLPTPTYAVMVRMIGPIIQVYADNVLRFSVTETTYQSNVSHGLRIQISDTVARIDDFSVRRPR